MLRISFLAKISAAIVLTLTMIPGAVAAAAPDLFLTIKGPSETRVQILSFSLAAPRTVGRDRGERAAVHDLTITKLIDKASPMLLTGRSFPMVILEDRRARGSYIAYTLENVMVTSARKADDGGRPTERVTFTFARITTAYRSSKE